MAGVAYSVRISAPLLRPFNKSSGAVENTFFNSVRTAQTLHLRRLDIYLKDLCNGAKVGLAYVTPAVGYVMYL